MTPRQDQAVAALKASDRKLARLIESTDPVDVTAWRRGRQLDDAFSTLVYGIIGQQISGYAARAIAGRLREHFGGRMPTPAELAATDGDTLRKVGLSRAKVEYVHSLAQHILAGDIQIDGLHKLPDDEVRRQITSSKGLGPWSADMFLMINLRRPDVLPTGDLGIRSAVQRLYKLDHLPTPGEVAAIGEKWRPNRSLASLYLWASGRPPAAAAAATVATRSPRKG
jgi:DNA-3-methyladenine glycosylase II